MGVQFQNGLLDRRRQLRLRRRLLRRRVAFDPQTPAPVPTATTRPRCPVRPTTWSRSSMPQRRLRHARCTSSPGKRTSTSATATSSSRRCRRRRAPVRCTRSTWRHRHGQLRAGRRRRDNGLPVGVTVPASTPTDNPTFLDIGGSPYEGMAKPLCDTKLVPLANGKSIAADVQRVHRRAAPRSLLGPARRRPELLDATRTRSTYGEKAGMPFAPVGIYDYTNRLVYTVESDYNGLFDVLLPSTNRINCPTPSGVCANMYRFVGNDPGMPGQPEPELQPAVPHDRSRVRGLPRRPASRPTSRRPRSASPSSCPAARCIAGRCALEPATPQLFAVSQPYRATGCRDVHDQRYWASAPTRAPARSRSTATAHRHRRRGTTPRSQATVPATSQRARTSCSIDQR